MQALRQQASQSLGPLILRFVVVAYFVACYVAHVIYVMHSAYSILQHNPAPYVQPRMCLQAWVQLLARIDPKFARLQIKKWRPNSPMPNSLAKLQPKRMFDKSWPSGQSIRYHRSIEIRTEHIAVLGVQPRVTLWTSKTLFSAPAGRDWWQGWAKGTSLISWQGSDWKAEFTLPTWSFRALCWTNKNSHLMTCSYV